MHAASAQSPFYLSGSVGGILPQDVTRTTTFFRPANPSMSATGTNTLTFGDGPAFNLGVGYHLPLGFRVEAELGYANYKVDGASPQANSPLFPALNGSRFGVGSGGNRDFYTATLNAFYDLPVPGRFVPYVGAGFGYYHLTAEASHFVTAQGRPGLTGNAAEANDVVALAEAGLTVRLDDRWSVAPAYRFEHLFTPTGPALDAHVFKLGVRYAF